ncbi:MAG: hypothetical protein CMH46_00510 [Muricauda sp.]|nr:hypothetical protein [Allomuricauda sp.]MAU14005.1 hypothetical protein [Allomuricauda sp.]
MENIKKFFQTNYSEVSAIFRDFVYIFALFHEASFTGSAGTSYKIFGSGIEYGGAVYFFWFLLNMLFSFFYNILYAKKLDLTSFWYYFFAWLAILQYGLQTAKDYQELGEDRDRWWALGNIETLGNTPRDPVAAEPIHWALVELFTYVLVIVDFVYCFRLLKWQSPNPAYENLRPDI